MAASIVGLIAALVVKFESPAKLVTVAVDELSWIDAEGSVKVVTVEVVSLVTMVPSAEQPELRPGRHFGVVLSAVGDMSSRLVPKLRCSQSTPTIVMFFRVLGP